MKDIHYNYARKMSASDDEDEDFYVVAIKRPHLHSLLIVCSSLVFLISIETHLFAL